MKSFQDFVNIVEAERRAYGNPTGYGPGGEPMYTKRPGPREPGRRATVQSSPQSVASVKADIEARRGFSGARSGGLEARPVPAQVTQVRQARATAAGTPDPWTSKAGRKFNFTPQDLENATTTLRNPMRSRGGSQAFADFIKDFSKETGTPRGEVLRQTVSGIPVPDAETSFRRMFGSALKSQRRAQLQNPTQARQLGLFSGSDQPVKSKLKAENLPQVDLEPKPPKTPVAKGQLDISDIKPPEPAKPSVTATPKPPEPAKPSATATPKPPEIPTPRSSARSASASKPFVDVQATTVSTERPKLNLGQGSAGPLTTVRPGQSQTIRPVSGPLGKPRAGQMINPEVNQVDVRDVSNPTLKINPVADVKEPPTNKQVVNQTSKYINQPSAAARPQRPQTTYPNQHSSILNKYTPQRTVSATPSNTNYIARTRQAMAARTAQQTQVQQTQRVAQQVRQQQRQTARAMSKLSAQKAGATTRLLGRGLGAASAGYDAYTGAKAELEKGSSMKRAIAKGLFQAAGGVIGAAAGGGAIPVVGTIAGASVGSQAAGKLFDVAAGENARERAARDLARRRSQEGEYLIGKGNTSVTQKGKTGFVSTGTGADRKTAQLASKKVITNPVTGQQQVGHLAFKTSPTGQKQAVYKTGETDPAKTTSNPLERIGRTYFKDLYTDSDRRQSEKQLALARKEQEKMKSKLGMS